jgi:hypothetical protein
MVWRVRSLEQAADWLRRQHLLHEDRDGRIGIAPQALQGVQVWLEP